MPRELLRPSRIRISRGLADDLVQAEWIETAKLAIREK